jgi:hypothetical protein
MYIYIPTHSHIYTDIYIIVLHSYTHLHNTKTYINLCVCQYVRARVSEICCRLEVYRNYVL